MLEVVSFLLLVLLCGVVCLVVYVRRAVATLEYIAWVVAGLEVVEPLEQAGAGADAPSAGQVLELRRD